MNVLCRMGIHPKTYPDTSFICTVNRCVHCAAIPDPKERQLAERVDALMGQAPRHLQGFDRTAWVLNRLIRTPKHAAMR